MTSMSNLTQLRYPPKPKQDREDSCDEQPANNRSLQAKNACTNCRKSKIRCNGGLPACGRCRALAKDCVYVENRRKSGPKRGYVKGLEARIGTYPSDSFLLLTGAADPAKMNT
jgi:hypothetical protein